MALLTILITMIYIPVPNKIRDIHIVYYDKKNTLQRFTSGACVFKNAI